MSQLNPGEISPWRRAAVPAAVVLATLAVVGLRPQDNYDASEAAPGQAVRLEAAPRRTSHAALEIEAAEAEAATPVRKADNPCKQKLTFKEMCVLSADAPSRL